MSTYIGFKKIDGKDLIHCALLPGCTAPVTAGSIEELVRQQKKVFGPNWREKVTFERPTGETLLDNDQQPYSFVDFRDCSIEAFEAAMEEAFAIT